MVDRTAFDEIIRAGGYISVNTGGVPDANAIPIPKRDADTAMDAASCIGCGACVAACKNASAMLFVSAKVSQFAVLPQGKIEARERFKIWWQKWTNLDLVIAQIPMPVRQSAQKKSLFRILPA